MNRKNFIKKGFWLSVGTFLFIPFIENNNQAKANTNFLKPDISSWKENEINIAWIGHSTVIINFYGKIILTDPVLFDRIGIYLFGMNYGPSRYSPPALSFNDIPKPDLILLSHAHMDHMDYMTLKKFTEKFPLQIDCITAYNTEDVIDDLNWKTLKIMDWKDEFEILGIKFKALEVKHFGWRFPWEKDRSKGYMKDGRSFNAYILEKNGTRILFGGDTAMTDKLKLSNELVDIAIMPIGAYNPWKFNHCNPEEALIMASELKAKIFLPIHCNTFKQGIEPQKEPLEWLFKSFSNYNLEIGFKEIGSTYTKT